MLSLFQRLAHTTSGLWTDSFVLSLVGVIFFVGVILVPGAESFFIFNKRMDSKKKETASFMLHNQAEGTIAAKVRVIIGS